MKSNYIKKLVVARLKTLKSNISFSIGPHGDFTRDELIQEVVRGSEVGKEFSELEIKLIKDSPKIVGILYQNSSTLGFEGDPEAKA